MTPPSLRSLRAFRPSRSTWALGITAAVYAMLGWLLDHATRAEGLLTPQGTPNLRVVALAAAYLVLRVAVRFGAPLVLSLLTRRALVSLRERALRARAGAGPR